MKHIPLYHGIALTLLLVVSACQSAPRPERGKPIAITPPPTEASAAPAIASPAAPPIFQRGTGEFALAPEQVTTRLAGDPQTLDIIFDHAPVVQVVQTLLSDYAGANVIIDPRVTGEISLRSQGQITAAELPEFMKQSVHAIGLDLLERGPNTYLLRPTPAGDSAEPPDLYRTGQPIPAGGVILPLHYVAASEMARLLAPFAKGSVNVQAETTREYLIITGSANQVESLVKTAQLLDVDWLQGMSFGLVVLENTEPDTIIPELQKLFGGANGPIGSMVEFVPLPARHAVLILAKRPERLDEARNWITQLDRTNLSRSSRLHVLTVHSGDAAKLAETVAGLYGGKDSTTKVTADVSRNALIIDADAGSFADIRDLVAELDKSPDQVVIEATIAEVTLNDELKYGVQWFFDTRNGGKATLSGVANGTITSSFPGFSYG